MDHKKITEETLKRLIGASGTQAKLGNWITVVALLDQAYLLAFELEMYAECDTLFNMYTDAKMKAYD